MQAILFNFSKRVNSTKRPDDATGVPVNVSIRQNVPKGQSSTQSGTETFLSHPTIWVQGDYTDCNYMKFKGRYYFIRDIQLTINNATVLYGEIDVLATYKDDILNTSAFVVYSSSNYDANLIDNRVATNVNKNRKTAMTLSSIFVGSRNAGCYVVTVSNNQNGTSSYALDEDDFNYLVNSLITSGQSLFDDLSKLFGDAIGGITSVRYVPVDRESLFQGYVQENIRIGEFATGANGYLTDGYVSETKDITIPWTYGDFRRSDEFTSITVGLPFIGNVTVSPDNLINKTTIRVEMVANCVTGVVNYALWSTDDENRNYLLATYSGGFGRQVAIASNQVDALGAVSGGLSAIGTATAGAIKNIAAPLALGGLGGGALLGVAAIGSALYSMKSAVKHDWTVLGGFNGGFGETIFNNYFIFLNSVVSRTDPSELTALYGRPCAKVLQLSSLSGYVETRNFYIDTNALLSFKEKINEMVDGGIYIE